MRHYCLYKCHILYVCLADLYVEVAPVHAVLVAPPIG